MLLEISHGLYNYFLLRQIISVVIIDDLFG